VNALARHEIDAVAQLIRDALEAPTLSLDDLQDPARPWTSHQTLDIIFGAEQALGVQFSSEQMETVQSFATLVAAIESVRRRLP
jgi:acyl carrier protein